MQRAIAYLAFVGLLISAVWHLGLLLDHDLLGPAGYYLCIGILLVWFPMMFFLPPEVQRQTHWKVWFTGGPHWLYPLLRVIVVYAIVNFCLGSLGIYSLQGPGFWRLASGHTMVFYGLAWGIAYAALRRQTLGSE